MKEAETYHSSLPSFLLSMPLSLAAILNQLNYLGQPLTKKTSTPINPPLRNLHSGNAWKAKTKKTAKALNPSMSERHSIDE